MLKKSKFLAEFKEFISRGNVMDLAVGIIVGTAFTAIVNALVNDVIMPFVGFLIGGIHFADLKWVISPATEQTAEVAIGYGALIQAIVNFLIIAFVVFCMVRMINLFRRKKETEEQAEAQEEKEQVSEELKVLQDIYKLLKKTQGQPSAEEDGEQ